MRYSVANCPDKRDLTDLPVTLKERDGELLSRRGREYQHKTTLFLFASSLIMPSGRKKEGSIYTIKDDPENRPIYRKIVTA